MDLIEDHQGENMADAGNRLQQHQALIIACGGMLFDMPLHLVELLIEQADEVEVEFNAFLGAGMFEAGCDTFAIEGIAQVFADFGQIILAVGVLDMGQQLSAKPHHMHATAHQIAGCAHGAWIDIGHGKLVV